MNKPKFKLICTRCKRDVWYNVDESWNNGGAKMSVAPCCCGKIEKDKALDDMKKELYEQLKPCGETLFLLHSRLGGLRKQMVEIVGALEEIAEGHAGANLAKSTLTNLLNFMNSMDDETKGNQLIAEFQQAIANGEILADFTGGKK